MPSFRLAHISDLHFSKVHFRLFPFSPKSWVGNINFLLRRKRQFDYKMLEALILSLQKEKVDHVLISGDLSCTSSHAEFIKAKAFVKTLEDAGMRVTLIPGNHDHLSKKSYKNKEFYRFFPKETLEKHAVEAEKLFDSWWLVSLDTTLATPLFCCHGEFSKAIEDKLTQVLSELPKESNVLLVNHFPIHHPKNKALRGEENLLALLKDNPKVKIYLHGHTHKRRIVDARPLNLPILTDSGCASHKFLGSWNLIELEDNQLSILPVIWKDHQWVPEQKQTFTL